MRYGKTSARKLGFDEALVLCKCLVQLLSKSFMSRLGEHAASGKLVGKKSYADIEIKGQVGNYKDRQGYAIYNEKL